MTRLSVTGALGGEGFDGFDDAGDVVVRHVGADGETDDFGRQLLGQWQRRQRASYISEAPTTTTGSS